jgi:hypothetical protein
VPFKLLTEGGMKRRQRISTSNYFDPKSVSQSGLCSLGNDLHETISGVDHMLSPSSAPHTPSP